MESAVDAAASRRRDGAGDGLGDEAGDEAGSVSLELVLLVPVLLLLTLFVLWAGRSGRVALTADLAASEAATAAALCCEEGEAGALDREAVVRDVLESRPGLEHLCIGGVRPAAAPGGEGQFVHEQWLEFEPGRRTAGVGVLDVRFECETDGAVAPMRGLLSTVAVQGQAAEVVLRNLRPPGIGFEASRFRAAERSSGRSARLVLTVASDLAVSRDVEVRYFIDEAAGTATAGDDYSTEIGGYDPVSQEGSVTIRRGRRKAAIGIDLIHDGVHEGTETLVVYLVALVDPETGDGFPPDDPDSPVVGDLLQATGEIVDDDPEPFLFVSAVGGLCQTVEGGSATFSVRLRDRGDARGAPSAAPVRVNVSTGDGRQPDASRNASAGSDYASLHESLTFEPGEHSKSVTVQTRDDESNPVGEQSEQFVVRLWGARGARLGHSPAEASCEIIDDEPVVTVRPAQAAEGSPISFAVHLDPPPTSDIELGYRLHDYLLAAHRAQRAATAACAGGDDYLPLSGVLLIPAGSRSAMLPPVGTCADSQAEPDEQFWLSVSRRSGEVYLPPGAGAAGTIIDDDVREVDEAVEDVPGDTSGGSLDDATDAIDDDVDDGTIIDDDVREVDEAVEDVADDASGGGPDDAADAVDRPAAGVPIVSIADARVSEDGRSIEFTLELHEPGAFDGRLRYTTAPMTAAWAPVGVAPATAGEDFVAASGTLDIAAGEVTATVTVAVSDDGRDEADEGFLLVLSSPIRLVLDDAAAVGVIVDDD
ncbi:Calx-beta domain-containing protein [Candidatus Poriferisodalis sp.]|uniref:Calx-beta domain-containing protein n=1 Tax=Candidatus Poriferisodalis sp. TaxID=3101277 RepID=UPI003B01F433